MLTFKLRDADDDANVHVLRTTCHLFRSSLQCIQSLVLAGTPYASGLFMHAAEKARRVGARFAGFSNGDIGYDGRRRS